MPFIETLEGHELQHAAINTDCFSICPQMDLLSYQLDEKVVLIYRRGNEKVWDIEPLTTISNDSEEDILIKVEWKPDGEMFTAVTSRGKIFVYETSTGEIIREFDLNTNISYLKWFSIEKTTDTKQKKKFEGLLQNIDIIKSLPQITSDKPSRLINVTKSQHDIKLNFIITASDEFKLCCIFSGIFVIDEIDVFVDYQPSYLEIIQVPLESQLYCITSKDNNLKLSRLITPMSNEDKHFNQTLSLCSKILALMDLFESSMKQINSHYKPYIDYTVRIIELLRGEINDETNDNENTSNKETQVYDENNPDNNDNKNADPIYDLYDLLLTGSLSNATKKWLTDYVSDRGIKRWTKLGKTYFDNAKSITLNDLITCLHHLIVHLTDLNGLNLWNQSQTSYTKYIDNCIGIAENFLKFAYKFMMQVSENQKSFEQTIIWLSNILDEITNDEKNTFNIRVNEITKYLMMLSERINNSNMEGNETSELNSYTYALQTETNLLFSNIKTDINLGFRIEFLTDINVPNDSKYISFKMFDGMKGYTLSNLDNRNILINQVDLQSLQQAQFSFLLSTTDDIVDIMMIGPQKLLVLFSHNAEIHSLDYSSSKATVIQSYQFESSSFNGESPFNAKYIRSNSCGNTFAVMDTNLKQYYWITV